MLKTYSNAYRLDHDYFNQERKSKSVEVKQVCICGEILSEVEESYGMCIVCQLKTRRVA